MHIYNNAFNIFIIPLDKMLLLVNNRMYLMIKV